MPWANVQALAQANNASGSSQALAYAANVTAGNLLAVTGQGYGTGLTLSASDTAGNAWTKAIQFSSAQAATTLAIFFAIAAASVASTPQLSWGSAVGGELAISEFSPPSAGTIGLDGSPGTGSGESATGGNPVAISATGTSGATDLLLAHFGWFGTLSATNSPWVGLNVNGNAAAYAINQPGNTATGSSQGSSNHWGAVVAALTVTAAGVAAAPFSPHRMPLGV
jgi:hypothetical protein